MIELDLGIRKARVWLDEAQGPEYEVTDILERALITSVLAKAVAVVVPTPDGSTQPGVSVNGFVHLDGRGSEGHLLSMVEWGHD